MPNFMSVWQVRLVYILDCVVNYVYELLIQLSLGHMGRLSRMHYELRLAVFVKTHVSLPWPHNGPYNINT